MAYSFVIIIVIVIIISINEIFLTSSRILTSRIVYIQLTIILIYGGGVELIYPRACGSYLLSPFQDNTLLDFNKVQIYPLN